MLRLIPVLLCLFGCVPQPPPFSPTQYISGPIVPDRVRPRTPLRAPNNAEIKARLDALSRSLGDLRQTIDKDEK